MKFKFIDGLPAVRMYALSIKRLDDAVNLPSFVTVNELTAFAFPYDPGVTLVIARLTVGVLCSPVPLLTIIFAISADEIVCT